MIGILNANIVAILPIIRVILGRVILGRVLIRGIRDLDVSTLVNVLPLEIMFLLTS